MEVIESNILSTCPLPFAGITGNLFLKAVTTVIAAHCTILDDFRWPPDNSAEIIEKVQSGFKYDYIVVGAGTAGSLVASRLSSIYPTKSTLLIEAGNDPGIDNEIPAFLFLNQNSSNDWYYKTNPDGKSCLGFKGNSCIWSKGKGLGGSSSMNAMIYIRGHPRDYLKWEQLGNIGWNYHDLLNYFEEQEQLFEITDTKFPGYKNEWYKTLDSAWDELGYNNHHYNNHEAVIGTKITRLLTKHGKRANTAKVYFKDASKLSIMKDTEVRKIVINKESKKAQGVQVRHKSGIVMEIGAKQEVILSAGSIATPEILMLSGIGPQSYLESMGIESLLDLPVGKNLQDHIMLPLYLKTNNNESLSPDIINLLLLQYMLTRTGPFSNIGLTDYMGFINTNDNNDWPNIQFHHFYLPKNDNFVLKPYLEGIGYKDEIIRAVMALNHEHAILGIYPTLLYPKSRGEILLNKSELFKPLITANYFEHPDDMISLIKAIDFIHTLEKTEIFKELGIELLNVAIPDCAGHVFNSNDYWECYIRHMATTVYHPVGTAKMGPPDDDTSVVNKDLLVHGMSNLRVVDASIMPTIPGGNTMAATLVIAQKAVDIIKNHYSDKDEL